MTTDTLIALTSILVSFAAMMIGTWSLFRERRAEREEFMAAMERTFREANDMHPMPVIPQRPQQLGILQAFERAGAASTFIVVAAAVGGASQFAAGNYWLTAGAGAFAILVLLINE